MISTTDTMTLTIRNVNNPPVAEAGPNLEVNEGGSINLQGSGFDIDGDIMTYTWSQDSRLSFNDVNSPTPIVTASSVTLDTDIILTLTVSDDVISATDTMMLTILNVTATNLPPSVSIESDQMVKEGATVNMRWSASDPDGDSLTYMWTQDPLTPVISFNNPNSSPTTFIAPQVNNDTVFTFTLNVTAGEHSTKDLISITVGNNNPPTTNAGNNKLVNEGETFMLSGTANDPDMDTLTYLWEVISGPHVTLINDDTLTPQFIAPKVTSDEDIIFRLTVIDTAGVSVSDTVTISIQDIPITVLSATYSYINGHLTITFSQDINTAPPQLILPYMFAVQDLTLAALHYIM